MTAMEEKFRRLSPERQKEVENFVDFLLLRDGGAVKSDIPLLQPENDVRTGGFVTAGREEQPTGDFTRKNEEQERSTQEVNLSDLAFQKRPRPDPDKLLEWID